MTEESELLTGQIIDGFQVLNLIGQGGFGNIYMVSEISTQTNFAMKTEWLNAEHRGIEREASILSRLQGSPMFPRIKKIGETEKFRYFIMELLGHSLSKIKHEYPNKRLSVQLALRCGIQMLKCIEQLHKHGFIHRDIKPGNFLVRSDNIYALVLIDFGLACSYVDTESGVHLPPRTERAFGGTSRYASLAALRGEDVSRKDDLISWFFSVVELATGNLPWKRCTGKEESLKQRKGVRPKDICNYLPKEMTKIYNNIIKLKFEETPDYALIYDLLKTSINKIAPESKNSLCVDLLGEEEIAKMSKSKLEKMSSFSNIVDISCSDNSLSKRRTSFIDSDISCDLNCRIC